MKKTAAIYARYSDGPGQNDQSIEGQVADCRAFADQNGLQIVEIYADRHISGRSVDGRLEFQRMLQDADRHRFDAVIVWKVDRFGRDRQDIALSKLRLKRAGVSLLYARESVPEGPEGILLESLLEGLAEYYSADLQQKVTRGLRETAKKGLYCGGPLPLGYKVDKDRRIVVDEPTAALVREAFRMHNAGAKMPELVALFRDAGVTGQRGKPISYGVVGRMLRNERYLGVFTVQGVDLDVEPIIDEATFREAAEHFRTSRNNAAGKAKVDYLLSCKCFCGYCGRMLAADSGTGKSGAVYRYYKCPAKKRGADPCLLRAVRQEALEDVVVRETISQVLTDAMIETLTRRILEVQEADLQNDPTALLRENLAQVRKKIDALFQLVEEGDAPRGTGARIRALEDEEDDLQAAIARAEIKKPRLTAEVIRAWLQSFRAGDVTDATFRHRLVDTFVNRVELRNGEALISYNIRERGPHSGVRIPDRWWRSRGGIRTRQPVVVDDWILLLVPLPVCV